MSEARSLTYDRLSNFTGGAQPAFTLARHVCSWPTCRGSDSLHPLQSFQDLIPSPRTSRPSFVIARVAPFEESLECGVRNADGPSPPTCRHNRQLPRSGPVVAATRSRRCAASWDPLVRSPRAPAAPRNGQAGRKVKPSRSADGHSGRGLLFRDRPSLGAVVVVKSSEYIGRHGPSLASGWVANLLGVVADEPSLAMGRPWNGLSTVGFGRRPFCCMRRVKCERPSILGSQGKDAWLPRQRECRLRPTHECGA